MPAKQFVISKIREFDAFYLSRLSKRQQSVAINVPLTLTQARVLEEIAKAKETSSSAISHSLSIDKSQLSHILKDFEHNRLIQRIRNTKDKRIFRISLTVKGTEYAKSLSNAQNRALQRELESLSPENQMQLISAMRDIQMLLDTKL